MRRLAASCAMATAVASALGAAPARAQDPPAAPDSGTLPASVWRFLGDSSRARWIRPAASLVVPGSGQLLGRSERGALYLVAEVFFLTRYLSLEHDGKREARQYRDLAFNVARRTFGPQLRDTVFDYFEAMGKYIESGPFDTSPGPELVPPLDERTFNGRIWLQARQTYFQHPDSTPDPSSPQYARALDFYRRRAVGPNFEWSWRSAALEQDLFRQTIRSSDDAFRHARGQLGLLLANHLLSAIDALVSSRLGRHHPVPGISGRIQLEGGAPGMAFPWRLLLQARF